MRDARFWKCIAVLAVAGLFYVGHGLHDFGGLQAPEIASPAFGQGVAVQDGGIAVTASEDGQTVYYFGPRRSATSFNTAAYQFLGQVNVP